MSDEIKKKQTKQGCLGCLGIIVIVALFVWFTSDGENNNENNSSESKPKINWSAVNNAVEKSRETGFLQKVDNPDRTVYVNYQMWSMMNAETKENSVVTFARYVGHLNDLDQAVGLTVKDWQSGKTIAEYSVWSGVTIK